MNTLPVSEIWLMDIDRSRLEVVGGFIQRMVNHRGASIKIVLSEDSRQSIAGADFVIPGLRVGQMQARREDEYLGKRHALVGQETTGIGGSGKSTAHDSRNTGLV